MANIINLGGGILQINKPTIIDAIVFAWRFYRYPDKYKLICMIKEATSGSDAQ